MPGGRPTDYKLQYCEEIIAFFDRDPMAGVVFTKTGAIAHGPIPPTFERFAHKIGVDRDTLNEWAKKHPEFSVALKKAKKLQRSFYAEALSSGVYSGGGAQFVAKNETDMVDKQEIVAKPDEETKGRLDATDKKIEEIRQKYEEEFKNELKKL